MNYSCMISGSESVRKTQAIGDRLQEANNINKGLLALGNCVSDICGNKTHIPFRNSTLTKVLRGEISFEFSILLNFRLIFQPYENSLF